MTESPDSRPEREAEPGGTASAPTGDADERTGRGGDVPRDQPGPDGPEGETPDQVEPDPPDDGWEPV